MKPKPNAFHLNPPGRYAAERETASDRDRAWFAAHPGATRYVRRRIPGEFGIHEDDPALAQHNYVEVTQHWPGYRTRQAIIVVRHRDYPSGRIPVEHTEALIDRAVELGGEWRFIDDSEIDDARDNARDNARDDAAGDDGAGGDGGDA